MSEKRLQCPERLTQETGRELLKELKAQRLEKGDKVVLDLSGTDFMDSRGGAWLMHIGQVAKRKHASLGWEGERGQVAEFIHLVGPTIAEGPQPKPHLPGFLEQVGDTGMKVYAEAKEMANLVVDAVYWMLLAPFEGRGFRFDLFLDELYEMGVRAVPINFVMNFLLGLTIAMMSAAQLRDFGLDIYVSYLVMIAFARELAAIMTGVVVSARTGAAITAEMANMKVQEEIDALRGMGLKVPQFLVAPKLLALVVVLPCLTAIGMVAGVLGGTVWGVLVLDYRLELWWNYTLESARVDDIFQGLLKSFFFANLIVLVGCHNGLRVTGGSRGVGLMTTRSVVMDIFGIVVIDMFFAAILYNVLG